MTRISTLSYDMTHAILTEASASELERIFDLVSRTIISLPIIVDEGTRLYNLLDMMETLSRRGGFALDVAGQEAMQVYAHTHGRLNAIRDDYKYLQATRRKLAALEQDSTEFVKIVDNKLADVTRDTSECRTPQPDDTIKSS